MLVLQLDLLCTREQGRSEENKACNVYKMFHTDNKIVRYATVGEPDYKDSKNTCLFYDKIARSELNLA